MFILHMLYIMIKKSISITDEQQVFIIKTNLNLSRFVQTRLNKRMKETHYEID